MSRSVRSPDYRQARDPLTEPDETERQGDDAPLTTRLRLRLVEPQN